MKKNHIFEGLNSFLILWASQAVSSLGTAMTNYALVVWIYEQEGTAMSVTTLTLCSYLPTILLRFIAGTLADRWNKKRIMLISDVLAACGSLTILALHSLSALRIWHLYAVNILLSVMNAVQSPAAYVATSLLVPKEQYARAGGLQSVSGAAVSILSPALGSLVYAQGGLNAVLAIDLFSFAAAFFPLLLFIRIPDTESAQNADNQSFIENCLYGIRYLHEHTPLLKLILFFTGINFLAKLGGDGLMASFILGRTGGEEQALGMVEASAALGVLTGGLLVALAKPAKSRVWSVFLNCGLTFLIGNAVLSVCRSVPLWCAAAYISYLTAAVMNVHLNALMRSCVPAAIQGRVFSARDTVQNISIPLGLYMGGMLADRVFEPFMAAPSPLQDVLSVLFGAGQGAGMAMQFFLAGICGFAASLYCLCRKVCRELDDQRNE